MATIGSRILLQSGSVQRLPLQLSIIRCTITAASFNNSSSAIDHVMKVARSYSSLSSRSPVCWSTVPVSHPVLRRLLHSSSMILSTAKPSKEMKKEERQSDGQGSVLMEVLQDKEQPKAVTVGAKVVEAGKDVSYLLVILGGFTLMGLLFYFVGSEFFSTNSPSRIFTKALKRIKNDEQVKQVMGEPISGHGELTGRGRRRHISNLEYIVDGVTYMRLKFHVSGSKRKGTAHMDLKKNENGKYECRFLYIELVGYPGGTILLEDNR